MQTFILQTEDRVAELLEDLTDYYREDLITRYRSNNPATLIVLALEKMKGEMIKEGIKR